MKVALAEASSMPQAWGNKEKRLRLSKRKNIKQKTCSTPLQVSEKGGVLSWGSRVLESRAGAGGQELRLQKRRFWLELMALRLGEVPHGAEPRALRRGCWPVPQKELLLWGEGALLGDAHGGRKATGEAKEKKDEEASLFSLLQLCSVALAHPAYWQSKQQQQQPAPAPSSQSRSFLNLKYLCLTVVKYNIG